jgi:hypothetical protein
MSRAVCLCALAVFGVIAAVLPATVGASTTSAFRADIHDNFRTCPPGIDLCGKGVVHGYGTATGTFTFFPTERVFTLDSDGSTLRIALVPTDLSPPTLAGTWTIEGGTGVFAGATGSGVIWATTTGVPVPSDTAHYVGTITLP